jgi:serpin B
MKHTITFLGMLFFVLLLNSCEQQPGDDYKPSIDFREDKKAAALISSDNSFALDLFKEVYESEESENYMISPLSVAIALGMTYNGTDGETKTAFEEALRLNGLDRHEINRIHGELIRHLMKVDPKVTMEIANSIWVNHFYTLLQAFADTNRYYYDAEINSLDFANPGSVDVINNWVSDKTHEKITEVLDQIPGGTVMYLINALYFYGTWKYEFDEKDNLPLNFRFEDGSKRQVQAMQMESDLAYNENEKFRMAELPYGNDKYSMMIMVPNEGYGIADIKDAMSFENWMDWMQDLQSTSMKIQLPKFKFEYKTLLNQVLSDMGLGVAFGGGAEFPLMVEESQDLYISRVIHKTFVDVNEKGTEAAAVTVVEIRETSAIDTPMLFTVDKPFLFVIREKTSNAIVFMGKVGNPEYN